MSKEPQTTFDTSKLNIQEGIINYKIYRQDGTFQPMSAPDTFHNRQCVDWIQSFDRYTKHGEEINGRI